LWYAVPDHSEPSPTYRSAPLMRCRLTSHAQNAAFLCSQNIHFWSSTAHPIHRLRPMPSPGTGSSAPTASRASPSRRTASGPAATPSRGAAAAVGVPLAHLLATCAPMLRVDLRTVTMIYVYVIGAIFSVHDGRNITPLTVLNITVHVMLLDKQIMAHTTSHVAPQPERCEPFKFCLSTNRWNSLANTIIFIVIPPPVSPITCCRGTGSGGLIKVFSKSTITFRASSGGGAQPLTQNWSPSNNQQGCVV